MIGALSLSSASRRSFLSVSAREVYSVHFARIFLSITGLFSYLIAVRRYSAAFAVFYYRILIVASIVGLHRLVGDGDALVSEVVCRACGRRRCRRRIGSCGKENGKRRVRVIRRGRGVFAFVRFAWYIRGWARTLLTSEEVHGCVDGCKGKARAVCKC